MAERKELIGVILAAGKGVRAYPSTRFIPKVLLQVDGKALIERNIELLRDQLGINKIIVVIGYLGHKITEFLSARDLVLKSKMRVIEVPVSYYRRIGGESKHSKNFIGASKTAIRMLKMIFKHRLNN